MWKINEVALTIACILTAAALVVLLWKVVLMGVP